MAGSIVLRGENETRAETGDTMVLVPKNGRYLQRVKEWWQARGGTQYVKVAVLNVTSGATTKKLAFVAQQDSYVHIEHDGSFNFEFSNWRELRHAALFTDGWVLEKQYVFPKSPGDVVQVLDASGQPEDQAPVEELKFLDQPLLTGTAKMTKTVSGELGTAQGGVPPYDIQGRYRYKEGGAGNWIYLSEFSPENHQELTISPPLAVGDKLNFYCKIEDAQGTVKQTGSTKTIVASD